MEWLIGIILAGIAAAGGWAAIAKMAGKPVLAWLWKPFKLKGEAKDKVKAKYFEKEAEKEQALKEGEKEVKQYQERLLKMADFTYLKLVASDKQLSIDSAYIRLKILEKQEISFKDPDFTTATTPNEHYYREQTRLLERSSKAYEPAEAVGKFPLMVIVGDPGAGKTTTMRFLARQAALGNFKDYNLPIFVPISKLTQSVEDDLAKFLPGFVEKEYGLDNAATFLDRQFEAGKILLLLDGLDEAGVLTTEEHSNFYLRTLDIIKRFQRRYPQTPIVVTCRKAGWSGGLEGFKVFEVLDFSWEDIQKFIEAWFCPNKTENETEKRKTSKLIAALNANVRMRFLAANPMLLSLICSVFDRDLELPERRAQLYQECVDWLLTRWDSSRALDRRSKFSSERKKDLLKELALYFHQKRQRYFEKNELLSRIADFLPQVNIEAEKAEAILYEIVANHGLLEEEGVGWYGFSHLTLQEYFCARALRDREEKKLEPILAHVGDPWWEEVTLLYTGMGDAAPLLRALLDAKDDIFHTNLFLATRCLAGTPRISDPLLRQKILDQAFLLACSEDQPYKACYNIGVALLDIRDDILRQKLFDRFIYISSNYIDLALLEALLPVFTPQYSEKFIELLILYKENAEDERSLLRSLNKIGDKFITRKLIKLLYDGDINNETKAIIASKLGEIGDKSIAFDLLRFLEDANVSENVKLGIIESLGNLGESAIKKELYNLLESNQINDSLTLRIVGVLKILGEGLSIKKYLIKLLVSEQLTEDQKWRIADSLVSIRDESIVIELVEIFRNEDTKDLLLEVIIVCLGQLNEKSIINELISLFNRNHISNTLKIRIASTLGILEEKSIAVTFLLSLLAELNLTSNDKEDIIYNLIQLDQKPVAIKYFIQLLKEPHNDPDTKWELAEVLFDKVDKSLIAALIELLKDIQVNDDVKELAAYFLKNSDDKEVAKELIKLLDIFTFADDVKIALYETISDLGEKSVAAQHLLCMMRDPQVTDRTRKGIALSIDAFTYSEESLIQFVDAVLSKNLFYTVYNDLYDALQELRLRLYRKDETGEFYTVPLPD